MVLVKIILSKVEYPTEGPSRVRGRRAEKAQGARARGGLQRGGHPDPPGHRVRRLPERPRRGGEDGRRVFELLLSAC